MLQKLLNGAEKGNLNAVETALEKGANVDVGIFPLGSIPSGFSAEDSRLLVGLAKCKH